MWWCIQYRVICDAFDHKKAAKVTKRLLQEHFYHKNVSKVWWCIQSRVIFDAFDYKKAAKVTKRLLKEHFYYKKASKVWWYIQSRVLLASSVQMLLGYFLGSFPSRARSLSFLAPAGQIIQFSHASDLDRRVVLTGRAGARHAQQNLVSANCTDQVSASLSLV